MTREDFYYDSRDNNSKIHGVKWMPDTDPVGIVILVHGMAEHLDRYVPFASYLCDRGFIVAGNEHLGHGKSVGNNPKGYFCRRDPATVVVRDVHRLKKLVQKDYVSLPVFVFGHSMGSMIARNYITRYGSGINGIIISGTVMMPKPVIGALGLVAGVLKLLQGSKHPSKFLDSLAFGTYCKRIENPKTSFDWLTKDDEIVKKFIDDPDCGFTFTINGFETLKETCARLHKVKLLEQIPKELPVLFIYGSEDPCGDYGTAVEGVYKQYVDLGIKDVSRIRYDGDRHELLNEFDKDVVMENVYDWIRERL